MRAAFWFLVALTILLGGAAARSWYVYDSRVDAVIERAQVAADRDDVRNWLTELRANLEDLEWTSGHFAVVWRTPENDLAQHYQTVCRLIERLDAISILPKGDVAYQTALADVRGTIRELPNPGAGMLWVRYWWTVALAGIGWGVFGWGVLLRGWSWRRRRPNRVAEILAAQEHREKEIDDEYA